MVLSLPGLASFPAEHRRDARSRSRRRQGGPVAELPAIAIEGPKGVGKTATAPQRARTIHRLDDFVQATPASVDPARPVTGSFLRHHGIRDADFPSDARRCWFVISTLLMPRRRITFPISAPPPPAVTSAPGAAPWRRLLTFAGPLADVRDKG